LADCSACTPGETGSRKQGKAMQTTIDALLRAVVYWRLPWLKTFSAPQGKPATLSALAGQFIVEIGFYVQRTFHSARRARCTYHRTDSSGRYAPG
jgi:hypothetical protein